MRTLGDALPFLRVMPGSAHHLWVLTLVSVFGCAERAENFLPPIPPPDNGNQDENDSGVVPAGDGDGDGLGDGDGDGLGDGDGDGDEPASVFPDAGPGPDEPEPPPATPWESGIPLETAPQKPGDPQAGYEYLVNGGYFGCGVPARFFSIVQPFATLDGISTEPLPGRDVKVGGADLAYTWNLATNHDGVEVVYMNCLQCHAGKFNGKLIVGLGNADADWTTNLGEVASAAPLLQFLLPTLAENKELDKFIGRLNVIGPLR